MTPRFTDRCQPGCTCRGKLRTRLATAARDRSGLAVIGFLVAMMVMA